MESFPLVGEMAQKMAKKGRVRIKTFTTGTFAKLLLNWVLTFLGLAMNMYSLDGLPLTL